MATPHVTALASYLLGIDPALTNSEVRERIVRNAEIADQNAGAEAADRIDAFASALDIDALRGDTAVIKMLLDIDDGTLDGNQRVDPDDPSLDFTDDDEDGNGGIGDGEIDMADFRRWRDLYLDFSTASGLNLDGSPDHIKRDLNGDGIVNDPKERFFPLGDFNGDATLDTLLTAEMSGTLYGFGPVTDLQVLQSQFVDPEYEKLDLPGLLFSGDIRVDARAFVIDPLIAEVFSRVEIESAGTEVDERLHDLGDPIHVYTLAVEDAPFKVTMWALDAGGDTVCTRTETYDLDPGQDHYWTPGCLGVVVDITLAEFAERETLTPVLVRAGVRDDSGNVTFAAGIEIELTVTGGSLVATSGVTDPDGFFSTSAAISAIADEMTVFVTATDPTSDASATTSATARPLEEEGNSTISVTGGMYSAGARAQASVSDVHDIQSDQNSEQISSTPVFAKDISLSATAQRGATDLASAEMTTSVDYSLDLAAGDSLLVVNGTLECEGTGRASGDLADIGSAIGSAEGGGAMNIEFTITGDPVPYIFQASAEDVGDAVGVSSGAVVNLRMVGVGSIHLVRDSEVSQSGTLEPGDYVLSASGSASAHNVQSGENTASAGFTVYLSLF
jgi:hypothetical protein